jgi:PPOX class probable F420-dependent enzyme
MNSSNSDSMTRISKLYEKTDWGKRTTQPAIPETTIAKLAELARERYVVVETYRRNGEPVQTPVWFVEHQGTIYVRTNTDTGKAKRIRRNSHVRIAASTGRGIPKNAWIDAEAVIGSAGDTKVAFSLLKTKYGIQYRLIRFVHWIQTRKDKSVALRITI